MPQQTPFHDAGAKIGASFVEEAGWLVPGRFRGLDEEYTAAREGAVLFDQSHRGKALLRGPDARSFLHRLSSNDIAGLPAGGACEAFLATAKAKVVAHFFAFIDAEKSESIWLDLAPGRAEATLQHLDRFLISEQIELLDRTCDLGQLHLAGPQARAVLDKVLPGPPPEKLHVRAGHWADGSAVQIRRTDFLGVEGYDLLCEVSSAEALWSGLLTAGAVPAGALAFHALRIEAGMPLYGVDITENTLAMEVDRTAQAISYKKGCFPGQEPIVRARDLGHVNWSLRGLKLSSTDMPPAGAKVFRDGAEVGRITSAAFSPRWNTAVALGYLRRGSDAALTPVRVETATGLCDGEVSGVPFSG